MIRSGDHAADPRDHVDERMGYDAWSLGCTIGYLRDGVRECTNEKVLTEAVECCDKAIADLEALKAETQAKIASQSFVGSMVAA